MPDLLTQRIFSNKKITNKPVKWAFLFLFLHFIARRDCLTRSRLTAFKKKIHHFLFSASAHSRCLEFHFLTGKSFISLSQSFTMPSLVRVRSFTLDSTLRKIRNPEKAGQLRLCLRIQVHKFQLRFNCSFCISLNKASLCGVLITHQH